MMRGKILLLTLCICPYCGFAQNHNMDIFLEKYAAAQVKSLDEFMQRFNAEEFHPDINYLEDENLRTRSLLTLFDWYEFNPEDSNVAYLLTDFADTVCWNDIHLDLENQGTFAEVQCLFEYNGQEIPINIVLVFENIKEDYYKWAVAGVNGLKETGLLDTIRNGYLKPIQHEMHFSELSKACATDLTRFVSVYKTIDQLSFFCGIHKSGQLRYLTNKQISFHFLQVPGFVFKVTRIKRIDYNSGFLICSLIRMDNDNKQKYIDNLLGL